MWVYFQMLYDAGKADLSGLPIIYAMISTVILLRTLFLVPSGTIPSELTEDYCITNETIIAKFKKNIIQVRVFLKINL